MIKIVIVEDEFRIRQGLGNLIEKINPECRVIGEAENGYEGLKLIRDTQPDIVITDIQMPKMNGLEMIEKIREYELQCRRLSFKTHNDYKGKGTVRKTFKRG